MVFCTVAKNLRPICSVLFAVPSVKLNGANRMPLAARKIANLGRHVLAPVRKSRDLFF
jgi:hypothetical protein